MKRRSNFMLLRQIFFNLKVTAVAVFGTVYRDHYTLQIQRILRVTEIQGHLGGI